MNTRDRRVCLHKVVDLYRLFMSGREAERLEQEDKLLDWLAALPGGPTEAQMKAGVNAAHHIMGLMPQDADQLVRVVVAAMWKEPTP